MKVIGVVGWSGSGKTTLLVGMLAALRARGVRVSTVKHAHHGFDLDRPGKDSFRHREAGASETLIVGGSRWALMHEIRDGSEPPLAALLARLEPVDLVLVEGFKAYPFPKIEVWRAAHGKPPIWPGTRDVVAVASDGPVPGCPVPVLPLDDHAAVAAFALDAAGPCPRG